MNIVKSNRIGNWKVPTKPNSDYVNNYDKTVIFCLLNSEVNSMNIFESLEYEVM